MIANWLNCTKCLFCRETEMEIAGEIFNQTYCRNKNKEVYSNDYCKDWTCKNCWQPWNSWEWLKDEENDIDIFVDHSKCKEVTFK
jgi:hypothetical protein